ncbi:MAG: hypothetical protein ACD_79C00386G0004 [uncultured bacterium]|nr:MAG: hypothetical protein ACD_79C00386G0004 [uncultured bacterium]
MIFLLKVLSKFFCFLPRHMGLKVGVFIGFLFRMANFKRNKICKRNMGIILGDISVERAETITKKMYENLGKNFIEYLRLPLYGKNLSPELFSIEGVEHLENVLKKKRGCIVITGHLGLWEIAPLMFSKFGKAAVIVKKIRNEKIDRFINYLRSFQNTRILTKKNSSKEIISLLKENALIGFVIDQNMNTDFGVYIKLGNMQACTLSAPALLALRYNVPVLCSFLVRIDDDNYKLIITPEIELIKTGDIKNDIKENTQEFSKVLEDCILKYPEQWTWMHRRFKNQPDGLKIY